MNVTERAELVKAMDLIARCINDENVFESWLISGMPDGELESSDNWDDEYGLGWYIQDERFAELMDTFLNVLAKARKHGGLYCDNVISKGE